MESLDYKRGGNTAPRRGALKTVLKVALCRLDSNTNNLGELLRNSDSDLPQLQFTMKRQEQPSCEIVHIIGSSSPLYDSHSVSSTCNI